MLAPVTITSFDPVTFDIGGCLKCGTGLPSDATTYECSPMPGCRMRYRICRACTWSAVLPGRADQWAREIEDRTMRIIASAWELHAGSDSTMHRC